MKNRIISFSMILSIIFVSIFSSVSYAIVGPSEFTIGDKDIALSWIEYATSYFVDTHGRLDEAIDAFVDKYGLMDNMDVEVTSIGYNIVGTDGYVNFDANNDRIGFGSGSFKSKQIRYSKDDANFWSVTYSTEKSDPLFGFYGTKLIYRATNTSASGLYYDLYNNKPSTTPPSSDSAESSEVIVINTTVEPFIRVSLDEGTVELGSASSLVVAESLLNTEISSNVTYNVTMMVSDFNSSENSLSVDGNLFVNDINLKSDSEVEIVRDGVAGINSQDLKFALYMPVLTEPGDYTTTLDLRVKQL